MTKRQQRFISLFPLQGEITDDIIKNAVNMSTKGCIGYLTLKAALSKVGFRISKNDDISWGAQDGIYDEKENPSWIGTKGKINMMIQRKPRLVTFVIHKKNPF